MKLKTFGGVALPTVQANVTISASMRSNLIELQDGSFDTDGDATHQKPFKITFTADVKSSIQTTVDALKKIAASGRHKLVAEMRDASERFTWAKVTDASFPANVGEWAFKQPLTMTFEVNYPFWMAVLDLGNDWDDGWLWDDGTTWDGAADVQSLTGTSNTYNIDASTATAQIRAGKIIVEPQAASSVTGFGIENSTNGLWFAYTSPLAALDILEINLLEQTITVNGEGKYKHLFWPDDQLEIMRLEPEINAMKVVLGGVSGTIKITYEYQRHYL